MSLREVMNGRLGVGLAYTISKAVPPSLGENLTGWIGAQLAIRKTLPMVQAMRTNQWIAHGERLDREALDRATAQAFKNSALSIYRFFRNFRDPQAMEKLVPFPEELNQHLQETISSKRGLIVTGVHLGNFDLVLQSAALQARKLRGIQALAISVPQPGKGYEWQNNFRRQNGLEIMPASLAAIKRAASLLEQGGVVISGLDRPIPDMKYRPHFFGRPASVPVLHVPLALRSKAPVVVTGAIGQADGSYMVFVSELLYLKSYPDRHQEIQNNAEMVLEVAESYIRHDPEQWSMSYPVWPEALAEVP
jgi:KDO2-lipid IV(A) lauroyltransferase